MRIIATILAGSAEVTVIQEAITSTVGLVDCWLLIDTQGRAELKQLAGDGIICTAFPWTGNMSDARNFALERAAKIPRAEWAMTLDVDERMVFSDAGQIRNRLQNELSDCSHLLVQHESLSYEKERFFNLTRRSGYWDGPVHECYVLAAPKRKTLTDITFSELPKTPAEQRLKDEHIISELEPYTKNSHSPRWHFYLAESYRNLGRWQDAVHEYGSCYALNGWAEESAWACYLAAVCLCNQDKQEEALKYCMLGLGRHGGIAELARLAAFICHGKQRYREAVQWAEYAAKRGAYSGDYEAQGRIGFREVENLWEGPYDVLRFSLKALGAEWRMAEVDYQRAKFKRLEISANSAGSK